MGAILFFRENDIAEGRRKLAGFVVGQGMISPADRQRPAISQPVRTL
ncbi:hypothetical protein [Agrobacterium fabrum]|nr:hypothetical protein [Agrobacterium fabrum]